MDDCPRFSLNRILMMLVHKQPFLDWMSSVDQNPLELTLDDLRNDNDTFLLPQFDDTDDAIAWVEKRWRFQMIMHSNQNGFTLIELIVVIVILGILSAIALPKYFDSSSSARTASVNSLGGSVNTAMSLVNAQVVVQGAGTSGSQSNITWITMPDGSQIRIWSGYPDRWCDGIGNILSNMTVPSGGCYLSAAGISVGGYTFYGYGNGQIPNGDSGWRIENAPSPQMCSVQYTYNGSGVPVVTVNTSGC